MSILGELQLPNGQAFVELFEIDATAQGGDITRFHAGTNGLRQPVVWQGNTYEPFPIMATGFEASGQQMARPKLAVANVNGLISAMLMQADLLGAKVIRRRTMVKFLDDVNFPIVQKPTPSVLTFTRASTATYYGSDGLLKVAAANEPRIDYDPLTLAVRGLLIEEQRTNLLLRSQEIDNASWVKTRTTVSANAVTAPDGTLTADKLVEDTQTGAHVLVQQITSVVSTVYTFSVFLDAGERTLAQVQITNSAGTVQFNARVNLADGTFTTTSGGSPTNTSASVMNVGNGFYRVSVSMAAPTTATQGIVWLRNAAGAITYTGDGTSGIYVWGAQLEAGAFATSYIPTTTAAVTRAADFASVTGANFSPWYNASEGALFVDGITAAGVPSASQVFAGITDGTANEFMVMRRLSGANIEFNVRNVSVTQASISTASNSHPNSTAFKMASAYQANDFASSSGGTLTGIDTAGNVPVVSQMQIGNLLGVNWLNGHIRRLRYYPRRFTNAELQTISGGGTVADLPAFEVDTSGGSLAVYTLAQWNPTADPNSYLPDDIWYISQKTTENAQVVEFELASPVDLEGVMIPGRQIQPNLCAWRYRGEGCGYAGGPVADANDNPTAILANDRCSKRTSGCKLRWGSNSELPFGGFPGAGLVRR